MGNITRRSKIHDVIITPLKIIEDDRGRIMHLLRSDSSVFTQFGEIYISVTNPNIIKGWKYHKEMQQNFAVPSGEIKLVIFDKRENSPTKGVVQEITTSKKDYKLITIPKCLWYSFKTISKEASSIINCATIPYTPGESLIKDIASSDIPYDWENK